MKILKPMTIALLILGPAAFGQRITVSSPAEGDRWALGDTASITWAASGVSGNVRINLVSRGGAVIGQVASSVPAAAGSHSWRVGTLAAGSAPAGDNYRIRIRAVGGDTAGESGPFSIVPGYTPPEHPGTLEPAPQLAVTAPRRTDRWCRGQPYVVAWTASGVSTPTVRIALRQGEREVLPLADAAPNSGSFRWEIPVTLAGGSYRVRVSSADLSRADDSDAFEIVSCAQAPAIEPGVELTPAERLRVTIPAGGEEWSVYGEHHIEWESPATSVCGTRVDILAQAFKGGTERLIARSVLNREGRNYYLWKIGEITFNPGQYRIRLVSSSGCTASSPLFHAAACDYGVAGATFANGRPLSDGATWEPGSSLELNLLARVTWNGVMPPSGSTNGLHASVRLRDGTERVVGTAAIPRTGFRNGAAALSLLCRLPMADVAVPMNMRIPIRFRIVSDVDRVGYNDEAESELRLLGHEPADLALRLDGAGLRIVRRYDALPTPSHRFTIDVFARNLTPNAAGGAPPPVSRVKCTWRLEEREGSGPWRQTMSNSFHFDSVPYGSERRMTAQYGVWLDEGKDYSLIFELDPDLEINDPQRGNNRASVRFRIPD